MEKIIKSYKGFNSDMTCRGFQYEVGKEYEYEGVVVLCSNGFHACENPLDVLDYYNDVNGKYCKVEQYGKIVSGDRKTASSRIKINAEIGFIGLFKAGVEWLKEITNPQKIIKAEEQSSGDFAKIGSSGDYAKIGSSGDFAKIGSSGRSAQIGSSGDLAKIESTGEDSVICCAGYDSTVKAKLGSWITLSEWRYDEKKGRRVPVYVKTEQVDGNIIKADTWYKLKNGEFTEANE